jgi:hypothetical protein
MRSLLAFLVGALALSGVAHAQTGAAPARATDRGFVEGFAESAFGNVTSQSFGAAIGVTVIKNVQVFVEGGVVRDVATSGLGAAAQTIAGYLSQTQANVTFHAKEPVTFGVAGVKFVVPMDSSPSRLNLQPYLVIGGGLAKVEQDVTFSIAGNDVTSNLATYGVQLGTDLSGSFTKPMLVLGGGIMWPAWQQLIVDVHYRYGRIFADDQGISVSRAGIGIGVRF